MRRSNRKLAYNERLQDDSQLSGSRLLKQTQVSRAELRREVASSIISVIVCLLIVGVPLCTIWSSGRVAQLIIPVAKVERGAYPAALGKPRSTSSQPTRSDTSISDMLPLRVVATRARNNEGDTWTCTDSPNSTLLLIDEPGSVMQGSSNRKLQVGCAFYCVQPPLSPADVEAGVDPTMLAYDVTAEEAAAEVSRRQSDPSYQRQDMFTCAWVPGEAVVRTRCEATDRGVGYEYIPPIAHTAMGPSDPESPLKYVNPRGCPMDLVGFATERPSSSCLPTRMHATFISGESSLLHPVYEKTCGVADLYTSHRRNLDGSPRPFWTFAGVMRLHYWAVQAYGRYVGRLASPALAAADEALQDELKPFYDRYVFPPLDTVNTFAAWSKRESAIAVIISDEHCSRSKIVEALGEHYPVHSLGRHMRSHDTLQVCESSVHEHSWAVNGDPKIHLKGHVPLHQRAADAPSPLNTTGYSYSISQRYATVRCAFQQYKFMLVFENTIEDDYVTEKMTNGMLSGAIPILIGSPTIDDFTPDLEGTAHFVYPSAFAESGSAAINITKPFINAVTDFKILNMDEIAKQRKRGSCNYVLSAEGTVPLQRLAEYLRWLETSPDAVERYLSWWRGTKWGAQFESLLHVPHYPCGVCARSHHAHTTRDRASFSSRKYTSGLNTLIRINDFPRFEVE